MNAKEKFEEIAKRLNLQPIDIEQDKRESDLFYLLLEILEQQNSEFLLDLSEQIYECKKAQSENEIPKTSPLDDSKEERLKFVIVQNLSNYDNEFSKELILALSEIVGKRENDK